LNLPPGPDDPSRLRLGLALFFLAAAVPSAILAGLAWHQLRFETFFEYRGQAENLTAAIDLRLQTAVSTLARREPNEFRFFRASDGSSGIIERSPLAAVPPPGDLPGLVGYFEFAPSGAFSTPALPESAEDLVLARLDESSLSRRNALAGELRRILAGNSVVEPVADGDESDRREAAAEPAVSESLVQALQTLEQEQQPGEAKAMTTAPAPASLGKLNELQLDADLQRKSERLERQTENRSAVPSVDDAGPRRRADASTDEPVSPAGFALTSLAADASPFRFGFLESGHALLYRDAWRDDGRHVQGAVLESDLFMDAVITDSFRKSALAVMSDLVVGYGDAAVRIVANDDSNDDNRRYSPATSELEGSLLHRARLTPPFDSIELVYSVTQLPPGPAGSLIVWTSAVVLLVLVGGCLPMYRTGLRHIRLVRQQQDFVAAVSHELRTPLTSIRMYGEMLRDGWVDDERRSQYYDYIQGESERLSRLIENVLQIARLSRGTVPLDCRPRRLAELADLVRSKCSTAVSRAGFGLDLGLDAQLADYRVSVDPDAFLQIAINLIDNAIKFAARADRRVIDCRFERDEAHSESAIVFCVRDFGPGIPEAELSRIFALFYRPGSELTRETAGTGLGLAIVRSLAAAMGGAVDARNRSPGAEFRVTLAAA